jgi:hypothetical protein
MVHAALLLLMLEAVTTDLVSTISLKRSTQNLQLSTSWPADYAIYLKRDDFKLNRHHALDSCLSMIFSENRFPLFGIML